MPSELRKGVNSHATDFEHKYSQAIDIVGEEIFYTPESCGIDPAGPNTAAANIFRHLSMLMGTIHKVSDTAFRT